MNSLLLEINDYKAIAHAKIKLEGITVVSGVNSSGKSTLSKILYHIIKTVLDFEERVYLGFESELNYTFHQLYRLANDNRLGTGKDDTLTSSLPKTIETVRLKDFFYHSIELYKTLFLEHEQKKPFGKKEIQRMAHILLPLSYRSREGDIQDIEGLFQSVINYIKSREKAALDNLKERPLSLFYSYLSPYLDSDVISFDLSEDDIPIIDNEDDRINNIYSIESVFYNDTPMSIDEQSVSYKNNDRYTIHRSFLKETLESSPLVSLTEEQKKINTELSSIISGNVSSEQIEFDKRFNYTRSTDKLNIDLVESATGIKAFGILQLLLSGGFLNEKTLLILDEPEAHLHPQWIVEYARIIVLLNKQLGVKFMIASHNPDMVSALRYISEKEKTLKNLRFYLAEKSNDKEQYNYRDLNTDIEPIFQTFNIALDRIDQYGI